MKKDIDDIDLEDLESERLMLNKVMIKSLSNGLKVAITGAFIMSLNDNIAFKLVTLGTTTVIVGGLFRKYDVYRQRLVLTNSLTKTRRK